jgi:hypothetical protein
MKLFFTELTGLLAHEAAVHNWLRGGVALWFKLECNLKLMKWGCAGNVSETWDGPGLCREEFTLALCTFKEIGTVTVLNLSRFMM